MAGAGEEEQTDGAALLRRVELAGERPIRLGPVTVDPPNRRISHEDGREGDVEPRSMKVLVALLRAPGTVFSRDDLFEACWEGRAVSDDAVDRAIMRLRRAIGPVAGEVVAVETVTKVGHRARVTIPDGPAAAAGSPATRGMSRETGGDRRVAALIGGAMLGLAGLIAIYFLFLAPQRAADPIAVGILPFTSASGEDGPLAAGLGDELRATLAGRSDLRLSRIDHIDAGPVSDSEARRIGAALGLGHVIGGDVLRRDDRLRIRTWIVDTRDGRRTWSSSVDGRVAEIGDLQESVSARVSSAIGLRILPVQAGRRTRGEVLALYLSARTLMRSRGIERMATAAALLREAEAIDPHYAPVQAKLGAAIALGVDKSDSDAVAAAKSEGLRHLRRALELDPNLAEAHGAMGMVLGFASPAAERHVIRAAELDPNDAEIQFWRGHLFANQLDFANQLLSYRRAAALDPLWRIAVYEIILVETQLGHHERAAAVARQFANASVEHRRAAGLAMLAWARSDLSEALRLLRLVRDARTGRQTSTPFIAELLDEAGLPDEARRLAPEQRERWTLRETGRISPAALGRLEAHRESVADIRDVVSLGIKRLLNSGSAGFLAARYDRPEGLLGVSRGARPSHLSLMKDGPLVALVLRQAGRDPEASDLVGRMVRQTRAMVRRGPVPTPLLAQAAAALALAGQRDDAIAMLERARAMGWIYRGPDSLPDMAEEPAYSSLRGDPRFERIRRHMLAHMARERGEILALLSGKG